MNWDAIGAVAEIVGIATVIVTVIYLAIEVRNNRKATEAASLDALASGFNSLHALTISNPDLAEIWTTALADPDEINEEGRLRMKLHIQSYVNQYAALRKHYESGLLPKDEWEAYSIPMAAMMNSPGARQLSEGISIPELAAKDFADYLDAAARSSWTAERLSD